MSFPSVEIVNSILDKRKFCNLAARKHLPVPLSFEVSTPEDFEYALARLTFPGIIKPAFRHYWYHKDFESIVGVPYKKAYRVETAGELRSFYEKIRKINPQVVLQEYVEGSDDQHFSVNMTVGTDGDILGYYIAQKVRVYPITAGMGCYIVTVEDKQILDEAINVVRSLDMHGLVNIQFKRDIRTGDPKLIELHARNSVWNNLGAMAGVNLPVLYYDNLTGIGHKPAPHYKSDVKYINLKRDIRSFIQYYRAGQLTPWQWLKTYRGKVVFARNIFEDPVPILMGYWFRIAKKSNEERPADPKESEVVTQKIKPTG